MTLVLALAIALTVLQVFDGWSTWRVLSTGGRELNPLVKAAIGKLGLVPALIAFKGGAAILVWVLVYYGEGNLRLGILIALTSLYAVVAINNWNRVKSITK